MEVFCGFGCNVCYKTDDGSLKNISEGNMMHLKDTLITFVGHADIINYTEIHLCQLCCEELIHFDKFRELCFSHLIPLRKMDLEGSRTNNTWTTFVQEEVLRRNSLATVSITTEYNEVKRFKDLDESNLDFKGQVINSQSQRNENEFVGDCSTGFVINSVIKCDESRVAFTNEEDIKNVMISRSEHPKLETFDVSNVNDTSQIQFMKKEIDLNDEIESSGTKICTLANFENKSGEQANFDVKEPVVNDSSESMKQELHVKQESSHSEGAMLERIANEFGDGVHAAFEIANVCTIVAERYGENEDIRNQEGKIAKKLRSRRRNNKLPAARIDAQPSCPLQSGAHDQVYQGVQTHTCAVCNKTFTRPNGLASHECIHSGARPYECTVCNKTFTQLSTLTKHERIHSGGRPYECTVCNKTFTRSGNLTKHGLVHSGARPYKCTVCNKTFSQLTNLTVHKHIHSGARPYKCTVCNKTFTQLTNLTVHKRIHSGARPYKCTVCNKTFAQLAHLTAHERVHSGVRPYECTVCNKMFTQSAHLTAHERVHSGARPYKCTVCNKTFTESGTLSKHKRVHSGARPYKCTVCNKTFTHLRTLTKHERIHSGASLYNSDDKP